MACCLLQDDPSRAKISVKTVRVLENTLLLSGKMLADSQRKIKSAWRQAVAWARKEGVDVPLNVSVNKLRIRIAESGLHDRWNKEWPLFAFDEIDLDISRKAMALSKENSERLRSRNGATWRRKKSDAKAQNAYQPRGPGGDDE